MADYSCGGYFKAPADSDSLAVDSLASGQAIEMVLDEFGNEVIQHKENHENANTHAQPEEHQAAEEPKHTKITEN